MERKVSAKDIEKSCAMRDYAGANPVTAIQLTEVKAMQSLFFVMFRSHPLVEASL